VPKLSIYLDEEREKRLAEIKDKIISEMRSPTISISIDLSKSRIISLAIDKLHEIVVGKQPRKEA